MSRLYLKKVKLRENLLTLNKIFDANNIELNLVTKCCLSKNEIITPLIKEGLVRGISDSNALNFKSLDKSYVGKIRRTLIKTRISDIKALPFLNENERATTLFISDKALLDEVRKSNIDIEVVLIIENGDRKEGFFPRDVLRVVEEYKDLNIKGISTNFSCLSGVLPTFSDIEKLEELAKEVGKELGKEPFLSIGGTVVFDLLKNGCLKNKVQEVRMGEAAFFGYDSSSGKAIEELNQNLFILEGESVEVSKKEILPSNDDEGFSATGEKKEGPVVTGIRKRAVLDFGVLVAHFKNLKSVDPKVIYAGQTFDFSVVDVTSSDKEYKTGDYVSFYTDYGSVAQSMINPYVDFVILNS